MSHVRDHVSLFIAWINRKPDGQSCLTTSRLACSTIDMRPGNAKSMSEAKYLNGVDFACEWSPSFEGVVQRFYVIRVGTIGPSMVKIRSYCFDVKLDAAMQTNFNLAPKLQSHWGGPGTARKLSAELDLTSYIPLFSNACMVALILIRIASAPGIELRKVKNSSRVKLK